MADPQVKIVLNAVDKTKSALQGVVGSFTEFSSALGLARTAGDLLGRAINSTISEFVDYAEQVRDMSRLTGASAEDTSRLIQVADDLKVEYGVLTRAAQYLAQDGMVPTIDVMAQLSDEYLAFTDKNKQAAWAYDKFGRNFQEVTRILEQGGDALRKMAADQPVGLILSQEDIDGAREYEIAIDTLQDTLQALAVTIGSEIVPKMAEFLNLTYKLINAGNVHYDTLDQIQENLKIAALNAGTYNEFLNDMNKEIQWFVVNGPKEARITQLQADAIARWTQQEWLRVKAAEQAKFAAEGVEFATEELVTAEELHGAVVDEQLQRQKDTADAYDEQTRMMDYVYYSTTRATEATEELNAELVKEKKAAEEAAVSIGEELSKAYGDLSTAQQNWNEKVASQSISIMESLPGVTDQEIMQVKGVLDGLFGTHYVQESLMQEDLENALKEFASEGDVAALKARLQEVADDYKTILGQGIKEAQDKVDNLEHALELLNQRRIDTYVDVHVTYPEGGVPASGGGTETPGATSTPPGSAAPGTIPPGGGPVNGTPFSGGQGITNINVYPADVSAANAGIAAAIAQARNQRDNIRMSAG